MADQKHLTLEQRNTIQEMLTNHYTFTKIGKALDKHPSTISKEICGHLVFVRSGFRYVNYNACAHRSTCSKTHLCATCHSPRHFRKCSRCSSCNRLCPDFKEVICPELLKPPYVCNGCEKRTYGCTLEKRYYYASAAQKEYLETLSESRSGISLTEEELRHLDDLISPLLGQNQSPHHICVTNADELMISESTVYRLVDSGVLTARNLNGDCGDIHGNDDYAGVPMMNCTGFVWHALWKASGLSYTDGINMIPAWGGIGAGAWKNFIQNNGLEYMTVKSGGAGEINEMLGTAMWSAKDANGKLFLEKGDIIWFWVDEIPLASDDLPVNGYFNGLADKCHVGIYWPKDGEQGNRWWDSIGICEYQGDEGVYLRNMLHGFTPKAPSVAMTIVKLGYSKPALTKVNVQKTSANSVMTEGKGNHRSV